MVIRCSWDRDDDIVHMSVHMLGRAHGLVNCIQGKTRVYLQGSLGQMDSVGDAPFPLVLFPIV